MKIQTIDYLEYFSSGANNFGIRQRFIDANSEVIGTQLDCRNYKFFSVISNIATNIYMQGEDKYIRPFVVYSTKGKDFITLYQKKIIYTDALLGNSDGYVLRSGGAGVAFPGKVNQVGSLTIVLFNEVQEFFASSNESIIKNGFNFKMAITGACSTFFMLNSLSRYDIDYIYNNTGATASTIVPILEMDIANFEANSALVAFFANASITWLKFSDKFSSLTYPTTAPLFRTSPIFNHKLSSSAGSTLTLYVSF